VIHPVAVAWMVDGGRGLREAFFMFWETLWALVLGFTLSGAVQAFVSRRRMRRALGDHRPAAVARASAYGMVSSSCSYAASAMAKSLFQRGADFLSAMVFMFASTNLVVELGIVIFVLLGWQFTVAEFVGGPIMIVLLVLGGSLVFTAAALARARSHLGRDRDADAGTDHAGSDDAGPAGAGPDDADHDASPDDHARTAPWRTLAGWSDAAGYAVADVTMLRKELAVGFLAAGVLAVWVPVSWWNDLFVHGHGFWTSVENAFVGPLIAVISWVCSIGNVPLAATLWQGGISFGGVVAFIFADLIAMPLVLVYRRYYGGRFALRMVAVFYVVMAVAGLIVGGLFTAAGAVPVRRATPIAPSHFSWDYTAYLNIVFIGVAAAVYWLHRRRHRLAEPEVFARDPVCGMQVRIAEAPASSSSADGAPVWFCSDRCRDRFDERRALGNESGAGPQPGAGKGRNALLGPRDRF